MLDGFHAMDEHFRTAPFERNLPVLMGLLAVWYTDFFGAQTVAVLPYDQYLKRFPAYLQQLTMESNGKRVTLDGAEVDYETARSTGASPAPTASTPSTSCIHQGTQLIPCDFIAFCRLPEPPGPHHDLLMANVFAQAEALAFGKTARRGRGRGRPRTGWCRTAPSRATAPPAPSCRSGSPRRRSGKLVALYEHSVFTQGAIWQHRFLRPVGRGAGQGAGPAHHPRAGGTAGRRWATTAPPTP